MAQTLKEWFNESEQNVQAIYYARNGQRYVYKRGQKLTRFAQRLRIEQVVDLAKNHKFIGWGAWLY